MEGALKSREVQDESLTPSQPASAPMWELGAQHQVRQVGPGWPAGVAHCRAPKRFIGLVHADVGARSGLGYFYENSKEVNYNPNHLLPEF